MAHRSISERDFIIIISPASLSLIDFEYLYYAIAGQKKPMLDWLISASDRVLRKKPHASFIDFRRCIHIDEFHVIVSFISLLWWDDTNITPIIAESVYLID